MLVELKARFDEENNIVWAKKLEQAGCHVIYGLVGLKTHCKIALVVRREEEGIRPLRASGHRKLQRFHREAVHGLRHVYLLPRCTVEDATAVFNMLSGYSEPASWNKLAVAPIWLRKRFIAHDSAGDPPCPGGEGRSDCGEDELPLRQGDYRESLRGFGRRRKDLI